MKLKLKSVGKSKITNQPWLLEGQQFFNRYLTVQTDFILQYMRS